MGSPASVVIAEIVMQNIEDIVIPKINQMILFWYRFVDDVIACVQHDQISHVLDKINAGHPSIQFTSEEENNSALNYLDMTLKKKEDGSLGFSIYRKSTHTDKYLDYSSTHPLEHKNSVIRTLYHRAQTLCDADALP